MGHALTDGHGRRRGGSYFSKMLLLVIALLGALGNAKAMHHMARDPLVWVSRRDDSKPLSIVNQCPETIWPAIATQAGTGPSSQGFSLAVGATQNMTVSSDWQGRVWGRTNCSFNQAGTGAANSGLTGGGTACTTGDCGGIISCRGTVRQPTSIKCFSRTDGSREIPL